MKRFELRSHQSAACSPDAAVPQDDAGSIDPRRTLADEVLGRLESPPCRSQRDLSRRGLFALAIGVPIAMASCGVGLSSSALLAADAQTSSQGKPIRLRLGDARLFRVRTTMELEGNVNIPSNPLVSRTGSRKLPIKSEAVFDYEERLILANKETAQRDRQSSSHTSESQDLPTVIAAERYYHEARHSGKINHTDLNQQLRRSVRHTMVRRDQSPEVIYPLEDYFRHEEVELLRVPISSCSLDQWLPIDEVTTGSSYALTPQQVAAVLNLSRIDQCDMKGEVAEIDSRYAKIQVRGKLTGRVEGVGTVIRIAAKLTFDRTHRVTTWAAIAVHETRQASVAEPGFDVAATIKMIREPIEQPIALKSKSPAIDVGTPVPQDRMYVDLSSRELGIGMLMTRSWRMMMDVPGAAMMRMIENDRSIAQCDFRPLATLPEDRRWSLEALQAEVQQMLGDQLTEIVEADESTSETGLNVLRVVALGAVQEVPIRWVVLHFSDTSGRRVLATFTLENDQIDRFAGSDQQLASTLRWEPEESENPAENGPDQPSGQPNAEITRANPGAKSVDQVQSASDLR